MTMPSWGRSAFLPSQGCSGFRGAIALCVVFALTGAVPVRGGDAPLPPSAAAITDAEIASAVGAIERIGNFGGGLKASYPAMATLGNAGERAVPRLAELLLDRRAGRLARQIAASILGQTGGEAATAALAESVRRDGSAYVRSTALMNLERVEGPGKSEAVLEALEDDSKMVRRYAAGAVGSLGEGGADAVPVLRKRLRSGNIHLRTVAARSLGEIGAPAAESVPDLLDLAAERGAGPGAWDRLVMSGLVSPLQPPLIGAASTSSAVGGMAASRSEVEHAASVAREAIRAIGPTAVPLLERAMSDGRRRIRSEAASALDDFNLGPARDVADMAAALHDTDPEVRLAAAADLAGMGASAHAATPTLIVALTDAEPAVRAAAVAAIGRVAQASPAVIAALRSAASGDADPVVREAASTAIANFHVGDAAAREAAPPPGIERR